jgi:hypothetical protein
VNNDRLEGPVLITVSAKHGLSAMDLLAYLGFLVAIWSTAMAPVRAWPASSPLPWLAAPPLFACGLILSYLYGN